MAGFVWRDLSAKHLYAGDRWSVKAVEFTKVYTLKSVAFVLAFVTSFFLAG
ncbi:MAG: hypothetical protein AAFP03_00770 [Cyanobacteria bacterium J06598_3]